jgi:hypothetical protein
MIKRLSKNMKQKEEGRDRKVNSNSVLLNILSSGFHFCYPFAVKAMFAMMFLYCILVGRFSKAKEPVFLLIIH